MSKWSADLIDLLNDLLTDLCSLIWYCSVSCSDGTENKGDPVWIINENMYTCTYLPRPRLEWPFPLLSAHAVAYRMTFELDLEWPHNDLLFLNQLADNRMNTVMIIPIRLSSIHSILSDYRYQRRDRLFIAIWIQKQTFSLNPISIDLKQQKSSKSNYWSVRRGHHLSGHSSRSKVIPCSLGSLHLGVQIDNSWHHLDGRGHFKEFNIDIYSLTSVFNGASSFPVA